MRCDFCGDNIEGVPFQKDGMTFCTLECSDALETGEAIPLGEEMLDDSEDSDDDDYDLNDEEEDDYEDDNYADGDLIEDPKSEDL
ncbi:MAG: hypothetical protein V3V99_14360 [candidate division Zixibacteria bacterium]